MDTMTIEQAMAIIAQVCANTMGTLKDHQVIQQAIQTVQNALDAQHGAVRGAEQAQGKQ